MKGFWFVTGFDHLLILIFVFGLGDGLDGLGGIQVSESQFMRVVIVDGIVMGCVKGLQFVQFLQFFVVEAGVHGFGLHDCFSMENSFRV